MATPEARQSSLASNLKHTAIMNEATPAVPRARKEIKLTAADETRFWAKVNKDGPTQPHMESPCWIWMAYKNNYGYGQFGVGDKILSAHRIVWTLAHCPIPNDNNSHGICVLHRCDVTSCVNPDHLFLGTQIDNIRDRDSKGRGNHTRGEKHHMRIHPEKARGEANGRAKLTIEQIIDIRTIYAAGGTTQRHLATQFDISEPTINQIIRRKKWAHVA